MAKKMDEGQIKSIVSQEITSALGYSGKLPQERMSAFKMYMGEPLGNEQPGRSKVVMRDAMDAVEWITPYLVKTLMGTSTPVEFNPRTPTDEDESKIVTEYVNYVLMMRNDGYNVIRTFIKDGLLAKNAFLKVYRDTRQITKTESYEGLSQLALDALLSQEGVEEVEIEEVPNLPTALEALNPQTAQMGVPAMDILPQDPEPTFNVKIRRTDRAGYTRIDPVPPEQILISRRAVTLDDASFVCHRVMRTKTELLEMGYSKKVVDSLPSDNTHEFNQERIERFHTDDEFPYTSRTDAPSQEIWVNECYIRIDENGDGKAELRKITVAGDTSCVILDDEEVDTLPFVSWCPVPIPHKFFGLSIVDQVADLQILRTTLVRGILDNIYLTLAPRIAYRKGSVEFNDLANHRPGAPIACEGDPASSVAPISIPFTAGQTFPVFQYTDSLLENRTGVNDTFMGGTPDLQNQTAAGANIQQNMAQQKLELIARELVEGFKKLCLKIYEQECKYQDKEVHIQLNGRWVPINPTSWKTQYDVVVNVGLGTGNKDQTLAHLNSILSIQQAAIAQQGGVTGPLVNLENVYNTVSRIAENAGFKNSEMFFSNPAKLPPQAQQPQAPKPDPNMIVAQAQAQALQAKTIQDGQKLQLEAQKLQMESQKLQLEHDLKISEMERKANLDAAELAQKAQLEREKMALDAQIKMKQFEMEGSLKATEMGLDLSIQKAKINMPQVNPGGEHL